MFVDGYRGFGGLRCDRGRPGVVMGLWMRLVETVDIVHMRMPTLINGDDSMP